MERVIEVALSEFVKTDKELKTFDGPAYKGLSATSSALPRSR